MTARGTPAGVAAAAILVWAIVVGCASGVAPSPTRPRPSGVGTPGSSAAPLLAAVAPQMPTGPTQLVHVVRVVDGDTIVVRISGRAVKLRYIGMDAPETVKPRTPVQRMGIEASQEDHRLVDGRDLVLEQDVSETDRFGRLLRYPWLHEGDRWTLVSLELVRLGYANAVTYPPDVKYGAAYRAAEREAREASRGLWGPP